MKVLLILGNQLFPKEFIEQYKNDHVVFMAEDYDLCQRFKYHKHKITFFLSAMRHYEKDLTLNGYKVNYLELSKGRILEKLESFIVKNKVTEVKCFEVEDKFFEKILQKKILNINIIKSPNFLCSREDFKDYLSKYKKPFMKSFYEKMRNDHEIMMANGKPLGGKYSYDNENRKKLPKDIYIPHIKKVKINDLTKNVIELVDKEFSSHPGDNANFWLPVNRDEALEWLDFFIENKFHNFGNYQDSITNESDFVFHSLISPFINTGLVNPKEVVDKLILEAQKNDIPLNSLEGIVRQIIGWREFIRGIYQNFSEKQDKENFWKFSRPLPKRWFEAKMGIPILDDCIKKAFKYGYNHHIERLMVMGNMMVLLGIAPKSSYNWFMQMYVDGSDWVMGPNVFGMAIFSDGGIFATKPYICGSNYYLKMSRYKKGPWCEIVDSLYWGFINDNLSFFEKNYRLSMMASLWKKKDDLLKKKLLKVRSDYIDSLWES